MKQRGLGKISLSLQKMSKGFIKQRGQVIESGQFRVWGWELAEWVGVLALRHKDPSSDSQYLLKARCNGVYQDLSAQGTKTRIQGLAS